MADKPITAKKSFTADWLMRGVLTKLGDTFDRFTGRSWQPSSSIATSELVERLKKLLDAEAREVKGKGTVVPHNIKLKMQWDKFSTDAEDSIERLENELMVAAADHINDKLYYTLAPLHLEVKSDYFTEGVKLYASFGQFDKEENEAELNVTMPSINVADVVEQLDRPRASAAFTLTASFMIAEKQREKSFELKANDRVSVGRGGTNSLILDDASVSKMHASLSINAEGVMAVADTGSTNGTFINGQRIAYGKAVLVNTDDKLKFGTVEVALAVQRHEPEPEPEPESEAVEGATAVGGLEFRSGGDTPLPAALEGERENEVNEPGEQQDDPPTSSQLGLTTERMETPKADVEEEPAA